MQRAGAPSKHGDRPTWQAQARPTQGPAVFRSEMFMEHAAIQALAGHFAGLVFLGYGLADRW